MRAFASRCARLHHRSGDCRRSRRRAGAAEESPLRRYVHEGRPPSIVIDDPKAVEKTDDARGRDSALDLPLQRESLSRRRTEDQHARRSANADERPRQHGDTPRGEEQRPRRVRPRTDDTAGDEDDVPPKTARHQSMRMRHGEDPRGRDARLALPQPQLPVVDEKVGGDGAVVDRARAGIRETEDDPEIDEEVRRDRPSADREEQRHRDRRRTWWIVETRVHPEQECARGPPLLPPGDPRRCACPKTAPAPKLPPPHRAGCSSCAARPRAAARTPRAGSSRR